LRARGRCLGWRALRARGSILHGLVGQVTVDPTLHGGPRNLESNCDLADRPAFVNDETGDLESVARGESGIRMRGRRTGCHWKRQRPMKAAAASTTQRSSAGAIMVVGGSPSHAC